MYILRLFFRPNILGIDMELMNLEDRNVVYKKLEKQNGKEHQILVAIEELSELQKELTKYLRKDSYTNSKRICDELADVKVVCEQLGRFFDPNYKLVPFIVQYKLTRLEMFYLKEQKEQKQK